MDVIPRPAQSQYNDLADLGRILSRVEVGPLLALFRRKPGRGRPPYDRLPLIYAFLSCYPLNIQSIQNLVDRLNNDPALRNICGFHGRIPHRSTFSRTFSVLAGHRRLFYDIFEELTRQILAFNPTMGNLLAVDASTVPAWANPNRKRTRDPEAGWTRAHSASTVNSDGMKWVYGYKLHLLACTEQALPLSFYVTPANQNDAPTLPELFNMTLESFPVLRPEAVMADRAYDGRPNNSFLNRQGVAAFIPRRRTANREANKHVYTTKGIPQCIGGKQMEYIGTHSETGEHGFRCPQEGCHRLQAELKYTVPCDDVIWESPTENVYEVGGRVARASPEWDELYNKRWEIERYFGLLKNNGWLENHRIRGLARVDLHITLAVLMFQAAALDRMAGDCIQAPLRGLDVV